MEWDIVLNPHGSDETVEKIALVPAWSIVLNPHGSDETRNHYS